ncbi:MAG: Trp biosynthesis-associated membrane protein [Actinomycetota bacterium]
MQSKRGSTPIGPILAIVGGALLAVGSFLAWAKVEGGGVSTSATGMDGSDGWITLASGLVAIACGLAAMRAGRRALAVLAMVAGLVGGGLGLYDALTAEDSVLDAAAEEIAPEFGVSVDEVRVLLDQAIDAGELSITLSIGLYLVIGGGVLALVGGGLMLSGGSKAPSMPAVVAAPGPMASPPSAPDPPSAPVQPTVAPPPAPPAPPPDAPAP